MRTINISLPESLAQVVQEKVKKEGYASFSEFFRTLLRRHLEETEPARELPIREFRPVSLDELRQSLEATGLYNKRFIDSVIKGFSRSSSYEDKAFKA